MEYFICVLYQNSEIVFYDTKKDSIFRSQFLNHIPIKSASLTLIDDGFVLISIDSNLYFLDSYSPGYYCTLDLHDSKFISAYGTHEHIYVIESKEQVKYFCVYNYQLINSLGKVELENVNETSKIFIESSHKLFIYDDTKFISYFFQENKTNEIEKTIEKVFEDFDVNINEDLKTNIRKVTYKITENDILNESVILNIINSLQINKNNETKVVKSLYIEHILFKDYITQSFKQIFTLLTIFNVFPMDKMTIKYKASINTLSLIYYTMYKFVNSEIYLKVKMIPFNSFESFREQISYFLYDSKFLHSLEPIDCIIFSSIFEDFMFPIRYLDLAIAYLNINDINSFFKTIHKTNLKNIPKNIILNIINILLKNQNYEQCEWIINNSFDNNEKIENEFLIPLMQCYISNAKFDMAVALLMERIKDKESVTEEIVNCLNGLIEALEINTMTQILIMYPFNEFQRNFVCEIFEKDGKEDISRTITQTLKKN